MAIPLVFARYGCGAVAIGAVALAGCGAKSEPTPAPPPMPSFSTFAQPPQQSAVRFPTTGFGATIRNVKVGFTFNDEWEVTFEAGFGHGAFGVTMPIFKFSGKDGSVVFIPDLSGTELSAEIGNRTLKWSRTDGFGRELSAKLPVMKGRLVYDAKVELPKSLGKLPAESGSLKLEAGRVTFTPLGAKPPDPAKPNSLFGQPRLPGSAAFRLVQPHVRQLLGTGPWMPDKGYCWSDGTSGFRPAETIDLTVRWNPGEQSLIPGHVRAAKKEGHWEPDPGYVWPSGSQEPLPEASAMASTVQWKAGLPWPNTPGIVSSDTEGKLRPAPGYTWATDQVGDLSVRPLP
ncbi:hypothetical protein J8F10_13485 [Gemmata sp. G18]|uniref:Lipoprotein n=1 Tax=Gemmata palustris TaxID=2822762 RepID=A0ABS5BRD0_9BACT|nr:hypothetical protein [Gemmata palustris]MBP3956297.1 hypothetical protein [Gemmata palustris]